MKAEQGRNSGIGCRNGNAELLPFCAGDPLDCFFEFGSIIARQFWVNHNDAEFAAKLFLQRIEPGNNLEAGAAPGGPKIEQGVLVVYRR